MSSRLHNKGDLYGNSIYPSNRCTSGSIFPFSRYDCKSKGLPTGFLLVPEDFLYIC